MAGSRITRSRRVWAALAALLWLLGVEVLPDAHLADHRADHTHAADGTIVAHPHDADRHDHEHDADGHDIVGDHHHDDGVDDDGGHEVDHDDDVDDHGGHDVDHGGHDGFLDHTGRLAIDHETPSHTAAGLAHHAQALHQPPPPLVAVFVPRALDWTLPTVSAPLASIPPASPTARGPPARTRFESS